MGSWGERLRWIVAGVLSVCLLSGCAGGDGGGSGSADDGAVEEVAPDAPGQEKSEADGGAVEREVVTTASATVEVREVRDAVDEVISQIEGHGGHVESRREQTDDDGRLGTAVLALRVPAAQLGEMLDDLAELGEVQDLSQRAQDVTTTARDLDARIEASETSVERLLEIMEQATSSEDLLETEATLSERQASLESLISEREALGDQVELSTLQLELQDGRAAAVRAEGFLGGLQSGWRGLVAVADGVLVALGAVLPWLPVLLIVVVAVRRLVRRGIRRRSGKVSVGEPDGSSTPEEGEGPAAEESASRDPAR